MAVRYNPNPARITEPLYKVEELEKGSIENPDDQCASFNP